MLINNLYKEKTLTKTGVEIPVTSSGKTIESKYNPERESENLLLSIKDNYNFFIVLGIGSGLFLSKLSQKFPKAKIIAVENTDDDLLFLQQFSNYSTLKINKNIIFSSLLSLKENIIKNYIPSLYGSLKIIEILPWINENHNYSSFIKDEIDSSLKIISADFSVQAHFGKIWQKNIINNIKLLNNNLLIKTQKKICSIIAAGPSLDKKIAYLKENSDNLFIISTDTAFSTLLKCNIYPEIVVSLDGQFVSHVHFLHNKLPPNTIFAFDLCADSSACKHIPQNQLLFFCSGHPLSSLINNYLNNSLLNLNAGSGTVTIAALDLAKQFGFNQIEVLGADFSYQNGKPYAKGTYLDSLYNTEGNKLFTNEFQFSKLQYRTELIKISEKKQTTEVLNSYKKSFEDYLQQNNYSFSQQNDKYLIKGNKNCENISFNYNISLNSETFFDFIKKEYESNNINFLLPFISYLRMKNTNLNFEELQNLAYSYFVSYNNKYEKK